MSVLLHHVGELGEEVVRIVRPRRSFRVILDAEQRQAFVAHAFVSVVVEVDVGDLNIAGRKRFGIDAEAVILRGAFDFLIQKILDGMIRTVVAKFQFEGFAA